MYGNAGDDSLCGGSGRDTIDGGKGADTMCGGSGNDLFKMNSSGDRVVETSGKGWDTVHSTVSYTLGSNVEAMVLKGTSARTATGNDLDNSICGNRISNRIDGGAGDDTVTGWNGNDTVKGGSGDDLFRFKTAPNETWNVDRIVDFKSSDDRLGFDNHVFGGLGSEGHLADSKFHAGSHAHDSSDRIIYDRASGKMYYDADGTGGADQILFAVFNAGTTITHDDLFVV
jgi:Ca2+-binding RTX toxin-like protein